MTDYQKVLEAEKEALKREIERLKHENVELRNLVNMQIRIRPPVDREPIQHLISCF